jgi:amino acid transporter
MTNCSDEELTLAQMVAMNLRRKAEWDEYKRRYKRWLYTFLAAFPMFGCGALIFNYGNTSRPMVVFVMLCVFVWGIMYGIATYRFLNWRCPICGKRFTLSWSSSLPMDICKHCGAELDS